MLQEIAQVTVTEGINNHPFQFYRKFTRRNLNVGFDIRDREINTDSSFSVIG